MIGAVEPVRIQLIILCCWDFPRVLRQYSLDLNLTFRAALCLREAQYDI